jgi:hypothetical protein
VFRGTERKYRLLFSSSSRRRKPGPKGPSAELIAAIVEMKRRNPRFGCVRIAQQVSHVFGIAIDKDVVRRVLAKHYRPGDTGSDGPSWLTFIAHAKDSLWSVDLFRCESILLRSHWVLVRESKCVDSRDGKFGNLSQIWPPHVESPRIASGNTRNNGSNQSVTVVAK